MTNDSNLSDQSPPNEINNTQDAPEAQTPSDADAAPAKKKTTRKKSTKKAAAKKTAKKTTKKAAAKKTTKKTTKKKTTKKTSSKADQPTAEEPVPEQVAEPLEEPTTDEHTDPTTTTAAKKTAKKTTKKAPAKPKAESKTAPATPSEMIVNYVPGEECRIAIVENGQLEEFYSEPTGAVSRVGNIYVGRVTNVESSIQAAFIDFGLTENGFLHSSDIHPQYFPSGSDTEQVGKKTPRRERPPIQQCLKKGQEITVQVLKEGVGTKGPSLTSYLSVPGRYLVMMPDMDSLGVSRKEEDEDVRREAKRVLAQLDVPDGFGFILRTAGFGRTKAELKRDLAYLHRLWTDMERRRKKGNKPRLLYSESDLLLRSLRDLVGANTTRVVIDDPTALERAARFLKIVSPRSQAKLASYNDPRPVFHAFGIEEQIKVISSPEVPLPSGGRLIIEQTEALVAIDVNSGKSRSAKDAETNAYKTNLEAADVICRQLRLRDLGGLVINDLIDMRHLRHRKAVEQRFLDRLYNDRAKSTILPISPFGILEMTRQRMRGSQESLNFSECTACKGRGLTQRPDSVTAEALRMLADVLTHEKVTRAELVVHPKIAGSLLSTRRASLTRVELRSGKKVDVRVSENLALDRVTIYAYDEAGNDIEVDRLRHNKQTPKVTPYDPGEIPDDQATEFAMDLKSEAAAQSTAALAEQLLHAAKEETDDSMLEIGEGDLPPEGDEPGKKKRRRRRRGGRGRNKSAENTDNNAEARDSDSIQAQDPQPSEQTASPESTEEDNAEGAAKKKRRRRRRGGKGRRPEGEGTETETSDGSESQPAQTYSNPTGHTSTTPAAPSNENPEDSPADSDDAATKKKRSRRRSRGGRGRGSEKNNDNSGSASAETTPTPAKPASSAEPKAPAKKKRRTLYSSTRRNLTATEADRTKD